MTTNQYGREVELRDGSWCLLLYGRVVERCVSEADAKRLLRASIDEAKDADISDKYYSRKYSF